MRLGRLFFAGAIVLGLAYFALRSPLLVADPRFLRADVADAGAPMSINASQDLSAAGAGWRELARKEGLDQIMVVDAAGAVTLTPELHKRLKFLHGITPVVAP